MKKLILLFLFTFLVYSNSFHIPFYFDDQHMILKNPFIRSFKFIPFFFKGFVTGYNFPQGMCRPLLMITFSLNYFFGKLNPVGYHLINLIFHILCGILLFLILKFLGVGNDETWEIIRDKDGRLLSIRVKRKVRSLWREKTF